MTREDRMAFLAALVWCGVLWALIALALKTVI